MEQLIRQRLKIIEHDFGVQVLYACESGSRAWCFASQDSDWDVRFIYLHPPAWYLAIDVERKRDVIEHLDGKLDISGWDLRKALWLFHKSNPPLIEWLTSPLVYIDRHGLAARLRSLLDLYYSPAACRHHYLHMARGNFREYLRGETVRTKKYLYVLRPLLALRWIETNGGPPPMPFDTLVDGLLPQGPLKSIVQDLLTRKKSGHELDQGPRIELLSRFLEAELARLETAMKNLRQAEKPSTEPLNELFREMLENVRNANERRSG